MSASMFSVLPPQLRLSLVVGAAVAAIGCAGTGPPPARAPGPMRILAVDQNGATIQTSTAGVERTNYSASPDELFRVTLLAFADIGVEPTVIDAQQKRIGNPGFIRTRTLGSVPLSRYLECGTNMSGVKADNDRITLVVESIIEADGTKDSAMRILVNASAKSMMGSSTAAVECASTGRLEQLLRNAVGLRLAKR